MSRLLRRLRDRFPSACRAACQALREIVPAGPSDEREADAHAIASHIRRSGTYVYLVAEARPRSSSTPPSRRRPGRRPPFSLEESILMCLLPGPSHEGGTCEGEEHADRPRGRRERIRSGRDGLPRSCQPWDLEIARTSQSSKMKIAMKPAARMKGSPGRCQVGSTRSAEPKRLTCAIRCLWQQSATARSTIAIIGRFMTEPLDRPPHPHRLHHLRHVMHPDNPRPLLDRVQGADDASPSGGPGIPAR